MPSPEVLAKAEPPHRNVVAVTYATTSLGKRICEHLASSGATVYALAEDPTDLARLSISFRQNNLTHRGIPCDTNNEESILHAIQDITNHAPPIDHWIHTEALNPKNEASLQPAFNAFVSHFKRRNKGHITLFIDTKSSIDHNYQVPLFITKSNVSDIVSTHLILGEESSFTYPPFSKNSPYERSPGIHLHDLEK